jgi:chromosome segregation ATPase
MHEDEDVNERLKFDSMDRSPSASHPPELLPFDLSPLASTACKPAERERRTSVQTDMLSENEDNTDTPTRWTYGLQRKLIAADSHSDIVRCFSRHSEILTNGSQLQAKVDSLTRMITDQEATIATPAQSLKCKQSLIDGLEKEKSRLEEKTTGLEADVLSLKSMRDEMEERLRAAHEV